jgi:Icc-related predicted phosphoesterase
LVTNCVYLQDELVELGGLKIYGTPWQPWFWDWAFNVKGEDKLKVIFDKIPNGTDVIISHGPPKGILSFARAIGQDAGSQALTEAIQRVKPKLFVCGHIHEAYGKEELNGTIFVNASICDLQYDPVNDPIVIDL